MRKLNIFLASSNELRHEREQFEIEIYRKGKAWFTKDIFLNLFIWEDLSAGISQTRSQDEYNKCILNADLFVLLARNKVGKYTHEEFETAFGNFKRRGKPNMLVYFMAPDAPSPEESLAAFKEKLAGLEYFPPADFTSFDQLWNQFNKELEALNLEELLKDKPATQGMSVLTFNAHLTRELCIAISEYNRDAKQLLEIDGVPGWEYITEINNAAKDIILSSYPGVVGSQLRRVMSIGKMPHSDEKAKDYIENCVILAKKSLQTVCFALISDLWNQKRAGAGAIVLTDTQKRQFNRFFSSLREYSLVDYYDLLISLLGIFKEHQAALSLTLKKMSVLFPLLDDSALLKDACEQLRDMDTLVQQDGQSITLWNCYETEVRLTHVLVAFNFLASYRMDSVRTIEYELLGGQKGYYLHNFMNLNSGQKEVMMKYRRQSLNNDAILLHTGRYQECISLFPFIVDMNTFDNSEGNNVLFFSCKGQSSEDANTSTLRFRFWSDNTTHEFSSGNPIGQLSFDDEDYKTDKDERVRLKKDNIFIQFEEAKTTLVG